MPPKVETAWERGLRHAKEVSGHATRTCRITLYVYRSHYIVYRGSVNKIRAILLQQLKKANMRKEQETDFEHKRLNLSVEEERELNKENDRYKNVHKDPYYDQ